jgi:hypothetical protein
MAFVADDLAAWLVGLLADRGRKKLTTLVLGTEQERALRSAATAAVEDVGRELRPGNVEQAEHVALVISQVFNEPVPTAPLAGHQTMLEALQTGIAGQVRVLDDASVTGQCQSSAELLGVPATVLAEKLTTCCGRSWSADHGADRWSHWPPNRTTTRLICRASRFIMRCASLAARSWKPSPGWMPLTREGSLARRRRQIYRVARTAAIRRPGPR